MGKTDIQWADYTFNPWEGCTKVAPECKNCYAETLVDHRFGRAKWGKGQPRRRTSENLWKQPLRWNKEAENKILAWDIFKQTQGASDNDLSAFIKPRRPRVFCLSLGDWLDEEVPIEWLADLLFLINKCRNLDWLLLTKRPGNFGSRIVAVMQWIAIQKGDTGEWAGLSVLLDRWHRTGDAWGNIWIGVSAGADQKAALEIPARIHFLSCEPMLHELDTTHAAGFDWIIFGGESGKNARGCEIGWIRDGLRFCRNYEIAAFVKQLGAQPYWINYEARSEFDCGGGILKLRDSHGGDMAEWPEDLRVREFPKVEVPA